MSMTIDEDKIRTETQRDAYERIVMKKPRPPGSSEFLSAEEKKAYYQLWEDIRNIPGCAKLMANTKEIPTHEPLQVILQFLILKRMDAILERLEEGPGASHE